MPSGPLMKLKLWSALVLAGGFDWDDEVERVPVEVLSTKPPREHPWLPVLFLLIAVGAALVVVYLTITP